MAVSYIFNFYDSDGTFFNYHEALPGDDRSLSEISGSRLKDGYVLTGWTTTQGSSVVEYTPDASTDVVASDHGYTVDLYAVWEALAPTITFNSTTGTFPTDSTTTKSVQANLDGTVSLSTLVEFPIKQSYVFKGWSTTENGSVVYTPYASPTITEDTTLYAVWEKAESYLVREDTLVNIANAIRTKSNTSATMTPDEMASAISGLSTKAILTLSTSHGTAPSNIGAKYTKPANPTATGYTFVNWYKDSTLTTLFDFDAVAEGCTAYAKWSINAPTVSNPDIEGDGTTSYTLGTVTPAGSGQTVYYSADNSTWSTTCPKQSAVGTYTTYWKITAQDCDDIFGSFTTTISSAPTLISFTIDNIAYQAEEGMTWAEWVDSEYNTPGCYVGTYTWDIGYSIIWFNSNMYIGKETDFSNPVKASDVIENGVKYATDNSPIAPK